METLCFHRSSTAQRLFTACTSSLYFHRAPTAKRSVFTCSSLVHKMTLFRRFTAAWRFWTILSNSFLSTPAAHRSSQNWTHRPKIGEVCLSECTILCHPFRGAKLRCQILTAENSALPCLKSFSQKSEKPPGLSKLNFQC